MSSMTLPLEMQGGWITQSHSLGAQVVSAEGSQALAGIAGSDALETAALHVGLSQEIYRHGKEIMESIQGEPHPLGDVSRQIAGLGMSAGIGQEHAGMQSTPAMPGLDEIYRGRS